MGKNLKSSHEKFKKESKKTLYKGIDLKTKPKKRLKPEMKFMEQLSNYLHLPSDLLAGAPIVVLTGQHELSLENYKGIIEYNDKIIKVQTKNSKLCIEGSNLTILYFTEDEMRITGLIQNVYYQG